MTSMIETALRQKQTRAPVAMASPSQPEGAEMNVVAPNAAVNSPIPQPVYEVEPASPPGKTPGDIWLIIQPLEDHSLLFRFSQSVCKAAGAEIAFFISSHRGIAIKLALRNHVSVLDILRDMAEVDDAREQRAFGEGANADILSLLSAPHADEVIRVILKAP